MHKQGPQHSRCGAKDCGLRAQGECRAQARASLQLSLWRGSDARLPTGGLHARALHHPGSDRGLCSSASGDLQLQLEAELRR